MCEMRSSESAGLVAGGRHDVGWLVPGALGAGRLTHLRGGGGDDRVGALDLMLKNPKHLLGARIMRIHMELEAVSAVLNGAQRLCEVVDKVDEDLFAGRHR